MFGMHVKDDLKVKSCVQRIQSFGDFNVGPAPPHNIETKQQQQTENKTKIWF